MTEEIIFLAKVRSIGTSLGITIPKNVKEFYELKIGDFVQVSLERLEKMKAREKKEKIQM